MKKLFTTVALGLFSISTVTPLAVADVNDTMLPVLGSADKAVVTQSGADMNIQITAGAGGLGTLNWNSYNVGKDATVNYEFTAHNQTALNKVAATGGLSQIYGKITNSGCYGCGYAETGKVILINPNGVLFGDGANVNLNSFTGTTFDAVYNEDSNVLELTKNADSKDIVVLGGAQINGDKNVAFVANNISTYAGSKITTNINPNVGDTAYGKVKLITADGVNFTYYNNGAIKELSNLKTATDAMHITLNGNINSGHIDVRNMSTNVNSDINLYGAALKATKAEKGNDGSIWLVASNKIVVDNSKLETVNKTDVAQTRDGGNIQISADNKVSLHSSSFDTVGNIIVDSVNDDVAFNNSTINTAKDVIITAGKIASVQNNAIINTGNLRLDGVDRAQIINSKVNASNDVVLLSNNDIWFKDAELTAGNNISALASTGFANIDGTTTANAKKIAIEAKKDIKTDGKFDIQNNKLQMVAGNDVDVTLVNAGNREKGVNIQGGNNVTVSTDSTLSVSNLISGNDMTINADKVIAGKDYTTVEHLNGETGVNRSLIAVGGKNFNSNTKNDKYDVTASGILTADGKYNQKHHIQYGEGVEKILLIHNRPYVAQGNPTPTPSPEPAQKVSTENDQAQMLNKLPRQPELYNNTANITDGRTQFIDVFAAASQIEIEDDEE